MPAYFGTIIMWAGKNFFRSALVISLAICGAQQTTRAQVLPGAAWTSLGPSPLASDASGIGVQDYGPVTGRVTAIAVDPADSSGNTIYISSAFGGVWKSENAGP